MPQEFEQLAAEVQKVEGDVVQARLENIRLSTSIAKKEALIRKKVQECGECRRGSGDNRGWRMQERGGVRRGVALHGQCRRVGERWCCV